MMNYKTTHFPTKIFQTEVTVASSVSFLATSSKLDFLNFISKLVMWHTLFIYFAQIDSVTHVVSVYVEREMLTYERTETKESRLRRLLSFFLFSFFFCYPGSWCVWLELAFLSLQTISSKYCPMAVEFKSYVC